MRGQRVRHLHRYRSQRLHAIGARRVEVERLAGHLAANPDHRVRAALDPVDGHAEQPAGRRKPRLELQPRLLSAGWSRRDKYQRRYHEHIQGRIRKLHDLLTRRATPHHPQGTNSQQGTNNQQGTDNQWTSLAGFRSSPQVRCSASR